MFFHTVHRFYQFLSSTLHFGVSLYKASSMSSLAAARADNFYHPPDYDPKKHKSLNKVYK